MRFYHVRHGSSDFLIVGTPVGMSYAEYWKILTGQTTPSHRLIFSARRRSGSWMLGHMLGSGVWSRDLIAALHSVRATGFQTYDIRAYPTTRTLVAIL